MELFPRVSYGVRACKKHNNSSYGSSKTNNWLKQKGRRGNKRNTGRKNGAGKLFAEYLFPIGDFFRRFLQGTRLGPLAQNKTFEGAISPICEGDRGLARDFLVAFNRFVGEI